MLALVALGVLVGALAQRIAGMGYALTLAPILVLAFGPYEGPLIVNIAGAFSSALIWAQTRQAVDWKQYWILATPAVAFIIPSAWLSVRFSGPGLQVGIGLLLIVALGTSLLVVRGERRLPRGRLGIIFGASSGFMSATAGIGGPAMGIYAILTGWEQRAFAATLQPYFLTLGTTSFVSKIVVSGEPPTADWWVWLGIGVLTVVGAWLGGKLTRFITPELARSIVIAVCFAGSLAAIVDGWIELSHA